MSTALIQLKEEPGFPISINAAAIATKLETINALVKVTEITTPEGLEIAGKALQEAAGVVKRMETSRETVKAPVLDLGRRIDAMAKEYSAPITTELNRVKKLVGDFHAAEATRLAEIRRKQEEEERKVREAAEALRREEAAKAEKERQELEAKANRARNEERKWELQMAAEEAAIATKELAAKQEAERATEQAASASRIVEMPAAAMGVASKTVWKFEVIDTAKVYAFNPTFCKVEVKSYDVTDAIKKGMRECPGLRIFEEVETKVRAR